MAKKETLTLEELLTLCDFDGKLYIQKKGADYLDALSRVFSLNNRNDIPFTLDDIKSQPTYESFSFAGKQDFQKICTLTITPLTYDPTTQKRKNESIKAINFVSKEAEQIFRASLGVAYLMTCTIDGIEYIIKIGQTRNTFKDRLGSYNCGCVTNWRTASTTNIKLKQSMVTTRIDVNLYLYDCQKTEVFEYHGIKSVPFASAFSLAVEDIMIKEFIKQFGQKPLINIQASATTVEE